MSPSVRLILTSLYDTSSHCVYLALSLCLLIKPWWQIHRQWDQDWMLDIVGRQDKTVSKLRAVSAPFSLTNSWPILFVVRLPVINLRQLRSGEIHRTPCIMVKTVSHISYHPINHFLKWMQHGGSPLFPPSIQDEKKLTSRKLLAPNSLEKWSWNTFSLPFPWDPLSLQKSLQLAKQKRPDVSLRHARHTWWPLQPH